MDTQTAPERETTAPFGQRWASQLDARPQTMWAVPAATALRELGGVDLAVAGGGAAHRRTRCAGLEQPVRPHVRRPQIRKSELGSGPSRRSSVWTRTSRSGCRDSG